MRKLATLIFLLFLVVTVSSQPLVVEWQKCFGGSGDDNACSIIRTIDGYLMATTNFTYGIYDDIVLTKMDFEGNLIWEKVFGGSLGDTPDRIFPTLDGNFIIVGSSGSSDGDISNDPYPGTLDYWVLKLDNSGNLIWENIYGGNCIVESRRGIYTYDGGIIAYGNISGGDGDISNYYGAWDAWMIKLDSTGNKVWDYTIGNSGTSFATDIIETSDHGLLVSSLFYPGTGGNIECDAYNLKTDIIVLKMDSLANEQWQQCYSGSGDETTKASLEVSDGYLLACQASSDDGDVAGAGYHLGYDHLGNQTSDIWLIKTGFSGNIIWSKCYGGTKNELARRIFPTDDGGFIVFGETYSIDGDVAGNHSSGPGFSDIWVIRIDSDGQLLWQQCFGGNGDERLISGVVDNGDGSYLIASTISGYNSGQITCQTNYDDDQIWLIKITDTTYVGTNHIAYQENILKAYPNPANNYVIFESQNKTTGVISVTDIYGRPVAEVPVNSEKTVWDPRGVRPGVYLYRVELNKTTSSGKILIMR